MTNNSTNIEGTLIFFGFVSFYLLIMVLWRCGCGPRSNRFPGQETSMQQNITPDYEHQEEQKKLDIPQQSTARPLSQNMPKEPEGQNL